MRLLEWVRDSYGALKILYRLSGLINLFCKRFDRASNCEIRKAAKLPAGFLNGQGIPPVADLPYGAWRMGRNGCEAIAVYNALLELGCPMTLPDVAGTLERCGLLFNGFGGTNLGALTRFFREYGIPCRILRRHKSAEFDPAFQAADCAILSYWTGKTLRRDNKRWNTLHTVSVHHRGSGVAVYNVSACGTRPVEAASVSEFLAWEGGAPVCLFVLRKIG